jgi:hypothetical protein
MFIPRSLSRIRRARLAFLAAGLVPTVAVVAWAVYRQSDAHRAAVERRWQEAVGLPLTVGHVEHPRPGVIRASGCVLPEAGSRPAVSLPRIEVESSADEDRIRIDQAVGNPASLEVAVGLARRWLAEEVRFRRTCLIEIADFSWPQAATDRAAAPPATLRIECVPRAEARAVRIVRKAGGADDVRIVRQPAEPGGSGFRYEVEATVSEPVPLAALALAAGAGQPDRLVACPDTMVVGRLRATSGETGWTGEAAGRIEGLDLAAAASGVGDRAAGTATIVVSRLAWVDGRVADGLVEASVGSGWLDRRLFDRIVLALSARPGPAAATPASDVLGFDSAACIVAVGPHGVQVLPAASSPGGLATFRGEALLLPPAAPVTADRVAWLFSSPGVVYGPTAGPGAWLMSVLPNPLPQPAATDDGRRF